MKKTIALILTLALLAAVCVPAAAAAETQTEYPVIIVPGYAACALFYENADGSPGGQAWGWNAIGDVILDKVKQVAPQLLTGVGLLGVGQARFLGETLGRAIRDLAWDLRCDGAGNSVVPLTTLPNDPAICRWDILKATYGSEFLCEQDIGSNLLDDMEPENLFNFYTDFRMGAQELAESLNEYVRAVKAYTGSERVNIYALSHGGQVTATYLSLYGENRDVHNAVLTVPAIGGAGFACDFLTNSFHLDEEELVRMIEAALNREEDFEWLVKAHQLGVLDDILTAAVPYAKEAAGGWHSLWDFIPMEDLDAVLAAQDTGVYAELIEKTTAYHTDIMAHMGENLRKCRAEYGVNVSVVSGCVGGGVTGYPAYADAILTVNATSGAKCAPLGKRFADGYTCTGDVCTDRTHSHLSPDMAIDASYAYLPENTWFVDGYFHGFTMNEPYTKTLVKTLLFTDGLTDVRADPAFPQFAFSTNKAYSVNGCFDHSLPGYLSGDDTAFTVANLSGDNEIEILSIRAAGLDLAFDGDYKTPLAPHESRSFSLTGEIPAVRAVRTTVTVTYKTKGTVSPYGERIFPVTVMNAEEATYDETHPYADRDMVSALGLKLPAPVVCLLKKLGVYDLYSMFYNILLHAAESLKFSVPKR